SWSFDFPIVDPGTTIAWSIVARDAMNNETEYPGSGMVERFRVYLAAPNNLSARDGRLVGTSVPLSWDEPDSPHEVVAYRLYRDGVAIFPDLVGTASIAQTPSSGTRSEIAS